MLRTEGKDTLSARQEGQEGAEGRMQQCAGHSPSVTEAGFLRLERRGLQEDFQGFPEGTLLKQALALGMQGAVPSACDFGPAASTSYREHPLGQEVRETRARDTAL